MVNPRITKSAARDRPIAALTAYDYPTGRILDEEGVDFILVGDSLGMVVHGMEDTTGVTLEMMTMHTAAVCRGVKNAFVVADLPYQTYKTPEEAVKNAAPLIAAGANAVKLEGGAGHAPQIRALTDSGITVVGHIGMLPQRVREEGGYKKKGRTEEQANKLIEDAKAVEEAGAVAIVLESMVARVAADITKRSGIPTIGIGAGSHCDGQILVVHDLFGAYPWFCPPFATPKADLAEDMRGAVRSYIIDIQEEN
ncbi:MAG: 3-methyl-2-oxobutanoate hydroxymethyltransferase [Verrucomicrobiota bacterium]